MISSNRFNASYPVGTVVDYWTGALSDEPIRSVTRTPAWDTYSGESLVGVEGYIGGISLSHIRIVFNVSPPPHSCLTKVSLECGM